MARRRWRLFKWAGLVLLLAVLAGWAVSTRRVVSYTGTGNKFLSFSFQCGGFAWLSGGANVPASMWGWRILPSQIPLAYWQWIPSIRYRGGQVVIWVPLWVPFLCIAIPTAYIFYCDRRIPPHCCPSCGYDLRGNVSGVCPECGRMIDNLAQRCIPQRWGSEK